MVLIGTMIAEVIDLPYSTADSLSTHYCVYKSVTDLIVCILGMTVRVP